MPKINQKEIKKQLEKVIIILNELGETLLSNQMLIIKNKIKITNEDLRRIYIMFVCNFKMHCSIKNRAKVKKLNEFMNYIYKYTN